MEFQEIIYEVPQQVLYLHSCPLFPFAARKIVASYLYTVTIEALVEKYVKDEYSTLLIAECLKTCYSHFGELDTEEISNLFLRYRQISSAEINVGNWLAFLSYFGKNGTTANWNKWLNHGIESRNSYSLLTFILLNETEKEERLSSLRTLAKEVNNPLVFYYLSQLEYPNYFSLKRAEDTGCVLAKWMRSTCSTNKIKKQDFQFFVQLLTSAGTLAAKFCLANLYFHVETPEKNYDTIAVTIYNEVANSDSFHNAEANRILGVMYALGSIDTEHTVVQREYLAFVHLKKAFDQGMLEIVMDMEYFAERVEEIETLERILEFSVNPTQTLNKAKERLLFDPTMKRIKQREIIYKLLHAGLSCRELLEGVDENNTQLITEIYAGQFELRTLKSALTFELDLLRLPKDLGKIIFSYLPWFDNV